jgi:periplasmic protein TonB
MTAQQILEADLLDILFENRNKEYGAYVLRRDYPSHLKKAVGLMLLLVIALCVYVLSQPKKPIYTTRTITLPPDQTLSKFKEEKKPEQPQQPRTVERTPPTRMNPVYRIVPDIEVTDTLPETNDKPDMAIGPTNDPGNGGEGSVAGTEAPQTVITSNVATEEPSGPEVWDPSAVSVLPEFPGCDEAWLRYLQRMLRVPDELESGDRKTVRVKFVVNADGAVTDAEIIQSAGTAFDKEVLRVINRMPKWKPGKQRGKPVAVYFTQPVTFASEEE